MGNSKARAVYEANLPDNFRRPQADTALESFIRAKYEHKKYIAKEWVETPPKPAVGVYRHCSFSESISILTFLLLNCFSHISV